jgi:propanol-preferring alcohol dehydrogenase
MAKVPDDLSSVNAAPLMCAGITVFNSMRKSGILAGETVAIVGIGGLGHLAIQFAAKMGYNVIAISGGSDKKDLAHQLGAHQYIDYKSQDPIKELVEIGGARMILYTASGGDISSFVTALSVGGKIYALGLTSDFTVPTTLSVTKRLSVVGWPSGSPIDSEATLKFSSLTGVKTYTEEFELDKGVEAYDRMMQGKARFRPVIVFK